MPAPSPVLPSASTAPRCQTAFSASMPASHHLAARLAVERGDQADAAGIELLGGVVAVGGGELGGAALVVADELSRRSCEIFLSSLLVAGEGTFYPSP